MKIQIERPFVAALTAAYPELHALADQLKLGPRADAEVYSEIVRRPLYRVHSGQLGLNVAEMETALKGALTRAQRWGAVMLIDEGCSVFRGLELGDPTLAEAA